MIKTYYEVLNKGTSNIKLSLFLIITFVVLFLSSSGLANAQVKINPQDLTKKAQLITFVLKDIKDKNAKLFEENQLVEDGYIYAKTKLTEANKAISSGELIEASRLLDEAFVNMTYVRTFVKKTPKSSEQQQKKYAKLNQSVEQFITSLSELLQDREDLSATKNFNKAKSLKQLATKLQQQNKLADANLKMEMSYNILVTTLSEASDKETRIVALNFETPKDEYLYEVNQYNSFTMLLKLRKANVNLSDKTLKTMGKFVTMSAQYNNQADALVAKLKYEEAILKLETANKHLKRALRVSGVNVF